MSSDLMSLAQLSKVADTEGPDTDSLALVYEYRYIRSVWLIALVLHVYDYFLTLNTEIKHIWKGSSVRAKLVFILTRYWGLLYLVAGNIFFATASHSAKLCKSWFNVFYNLLVPLHASFFLIAFARLQAGLQLSRNVMLGLTVIFGGQIIVITVLVAIFASDFDSVVLPPQWTGCIPWNTGKRALIVWIPLATNEGILFLVVVFGSIRTLRRRASLPLALKVILWDSVIYLIAQSASMMFNNIYTDATAPNTAFSTLPPILVALTSTLGCRMLLNLHDAFDTTIAGRIHVTSTISLSTLRFRTSDLGL